MQVRSSVIAMALVAVTAGAAAQTQPQDPAATSAAPLSTTPSSAAPSNPSTSTAAPLRTPHNRFYFGLSAGRSKYKINPGEVDELDETDAAGAYRFGWQIQPQSPFAVEAFLQYFAGIGGIVNTVFNADDLYPFAHFGVAVTGRMPLTGRLSAQGRIGIGQTWLESEGQPDRNRNITDPSVGLGLVLGPVWRLDLGLEAVRFTRSHITTEQFVVALRF